jgi:signal transduction histidine kinase
MARARKTSRPPSLIRQLAAIHASIGFIALVLGAIVLHQTLSSVVWDQHRRSILASAHEVLQRLSREGVEGLARPLSPEVARRFDDSTGSMRYAVMRPNGDLLLVSPGAAAVLPRRENAELPESFLEGADGSRLWGVTERIATSRGPLIVQIAQDMERSYVVLDDIAPAAVGPILAVLGLGALVLFGASALLLTMALRPLQRAAAEAAMIGKGGPARLDDGGMAEEVRPLILAMNGALDRLDEALTWHRGFSEEVAHELRTPLALMQAELDLLDPGPTRDRLLRDVEGLAQLVTDLLEAAEASRELPAAGAAFDLGELAGEMARRLAPMAEREGRRVMIDAAGAGGLVRGNRDALGRALRNLIENALSHAPAGSTVEVRLPPAAAPDEVAVAVADHGPGVPAAERQKVFRRNWRAGDTHRRGLGLGLSIVERIARAHGGRVEVGDNPGGGAVFTITLPAAAPEGAAA